MAARKKTTRPARAPKPEVKSEPKPDPAVTLAVFAAIYPEARSKVKMSDTPEQVVEGLIEEAEGVAKVWAKRQ